MSGVWTPLAVPGKPELEARLSRVQTCLIIWLHFLPRPILTLKYTRTWMATQRC